MKKFDELVESILEVDMGKYKDKFDLSPKKISEIVTDADVKDKLTGEERDSLEEDLNDLMSKIHKKYKGKSDGSEPFWKEAVKIGKEYGIVISRRGGGRPD